ncbi:MAG: ABC transporter permease [Gemmatimonadales bacterium]
MRGFLSDLRYSWRALRRSPGFTLAAVATIGLSIAANTTIFSVVNGILLRPLPFPDADRLIVLCETNPAVAQFCVASPPDVEDWRESSRTLASVGIGRDWPFLLRENTRVEHVDGGVASPEFFQTLGLTAAIGRLPSPADQAPGAAKVAVLSQNLWRGRFGGDTAVLGRTVMLDGEPHIVIGVLPEGAEVPGLEQVAMWTPLPFDPKDEENRSWRGFRTVGRLAPGVTLDQAGDELGGIARALAAGHPATNDGWGVSISGLQDHLVQPVSRTLLVMLGAVVLVLLIGCANVANLMLARVSDRRRELAIRLALGGGLWASGRLLLSEALIVSLIGAGTGLVLSLWGIDAFRALAPGGIPRLDTVALDGRVLLFTLLISTGTALALGLASMIHLRRDRPGDVLRSGSRTLSGSGLQLRRGLISLEVALALVLLIAAGLLGRSLLRLVNWDPGFEQEHLAVTWLLASSDRYPEPAQVSALFARVAGETATMPGVRSVGRASAGPLFGGIETDAMEIVGRPQPAPGEEPTVRWFDIDPGYFPTLGVPIIQGRGITGTDGAGSLPVALINEAAVRRYWPGQDPLGARVAMYGRTMTIVGVVRDIPPIRPDDPVEPAIYWPQAQAPRWGTYLVLRTSQDPEGIERALAARLQTVDPDLTPAGFRTMPAMVSRKLVSPRFMTALIGTFALLAVVIAVVGIWGVTAYAVARQRREIGIRLALGAQAGGVLREVLAGTMAPVSVGLIAGLLLAFATGSAIRSLLAGTEPADPLTYAVVAAGVVLVTLAAGYIPARQATRVDPAVVLREE